MKAGVMISSKRREDLEMLRTGIIRSERQVLELAREHVGLDEPGGTP